MHLGPRTTMRRNYTTFISEIPSGSILTIGTSSPSKQSIIILILVPLCVLVLCTVAGFAGICILLKLNLIQKQRKECSTANEVKQPCYEVIDPIYETIPSTESENLTRVNFGIAMMRNDAYAYNNIHSQKKKCHQSPLLDFNVSRNEAYDTMQ